MTEPVTMKELKRLAVETVDDYMDEIGERITDGEDVNDFLIELVTGIIPIWSNSIALVLANNVELMHRTLIPSVSTIHEAAATLIGTELFHTARAHLDSIIERLEDEQIERQVEAKERAMDGGQSDWERRQR